VASRLQHNGDVRWLFAIAATLASGCFYLDPINERPSAEIKHDNPEVPLIRGGTDPTKDAAVVSAIYSDPNNDPMAVTWAVYGCSADGATCNATPFATGTEPQLQINVPQADYIAAVSVHLVVTDSHGAIARPEQVLVLPVTDRDPLLDLSIDGPIWNQKFRPVHLPITVRADISDPDGDTVTLVWDPPFATGTDTQKSAWTIISDTEHPCRCRSAAVPRAIRSGARHDPRSSDPFHRAHRRR